MTLSPDTVTISYLTITAPGFNFRDNVLTINLTVNAPVNITVSNSNNIDTIFDVIV